MGLSLPVGRLALIATLLAIWFKIATAPSEIVVGTVAQRIVGAFVMQGGLLVGGKMLLSNSRASVGSDS